MKNRLFYDLMRFAAAQKNGKEKLIYMLRGIIYYFFLLKTVSGSAKGNHASSGSESGDDIYPLF